MPEKNSNISLSYAKKPEPPREPEAWECCQNGCDPCVYDRYWEALARYEQALQVWEARQGRPEN
jgi:hypothetical protein